MARTAKQRAATKRMIAANKARGGSSGAKRRKSTKKGAKRAKAKSHRGHTLEARVAKLEKNQKVIVGVLHSHQKALVGGGLLSARAARALPKGH